MASSATTSSVWVGHLDPTPAERAALEATLAAFAAASDDVVAAGRAEGTAANARLHAACYRRLREQHGLSANLAVRAIAHGAGRLRRREGPGPMPPHQVGLDARVLAFPAPGTVSLTTIHGRCRAVRLRPGGPRVPERAHVVRAVLVRDGDAFRLDVTFATDR